MKPDLKVYVASSWRNAWQPFVVNALREAGCDVYDFRNPEPGNTGFSWAQINPNYKPGHKIDARTWLRWLAHPAAQAGFRLDFEAMDEADACVLVLPAGRSAHIEAGYMAGQGKPVHVVATDVEEPDLMHNIFRSINGSMPDLLRSMGLPVVPPFDTVEYAAKEAVNDAVMAAAVREGAQKAARFRMSAACAVLDDTDPNVQPDVSSQYVDAAVGGKPKSLHNSDANGAVKNVPDIVKVGNPDRWRLVCKASSEAEGWMKSTKAMQAGDGVLVQVTTQQRNPDGSYAVAEALSFVPCAVLRDTDQGAPLMRIACA